jgi:murein DD-endopeptidase MepM/ murein hydrolase activator NlpD
VPWFVAGVGIPLLAFALIGPQKEADPEPEQAAIAIEEPAAQASAEQASSRAPAESAAPAIAAAKLPVAENPAGTDLVMTIRRGDSLDRLFSRNDLSRADLAAIMQTELGRKHLRLVRPGDEIAVRHDGEQVLSLSRDLNLTQALQIQRAGDDFNAQLIDRELERRIAGASGEISSSLFLAAADAGISDRTIMNLAGIFAWDVDFVLDIRTGDEFQIIYDELWRDGERLGDGEILAAEFINQGQSFRAIRFEDPEGRVDYYTPDGLSVRKAFVRAPLSFSRISSNFNPKRRHPKLNTIRAHKGVDYAAPTGTPVKAAGDGKVIHRGVKGGYGKTVILQHGGNITTLYAHMSRYGNFRNGSRVRQGQIIGYVGSTGLATGPHLHYEYRSNGVHRNPRTVKLPEADPINPEYLPEFRAIASDLLEQLETRPSLAVAQVDVTKI